MTELLMCVTGFVARVDGVDHWVSAGEIAHRDAAPVLHHPGAFAPLPIQWTADGGWERQSPDGQGSPAPMPPKRRGGRRRV